MKVLNAKKTKGAMQPRVVTAKSPQGKLASNVITLKRRELVGSLTPASNVFAVTAKSSAIPGYDLVPSNGEMFPWLSHVAQVFEMYRFKRLSVSLISGQPSTAVGRVYMAADPDWSDPVPSTKTGICGMACSVSAAVWEPVTLVIPIERFAGQTAWRYLSSSSRAGDEEPRTTYYGWLAFATECSNTYTWDIWVDYEVELREPTAESLGLVEAEVTQADVTDSYSALYPNWPRRTQIPVKTPGEVGIGFISSLPGNVSKATMIEMPRTGGGTIETVFDVSEAATTPDDYMTNGALHLGKVYDWVGTVLANLNYTETSYYKVVNGVTKPSEWTTAGNPYRMRATFLIDQLKKAFPQAAYILSYVQLGSAALAVDALRSQIRYEL